MDAAGSVTGWVLGRLLSRIACCVQIFCAMLGGAATTYSMRCVNQAVPCRWDAAMAEHHNHTIIFYIATHALSTTALDCFLYCRLDIPMAEQGNSNIYLDTAQLVAAVCTACCTVQLCTAGWTLPWLSRATSTSSTVTTRMHRCCCIYCTAC